MEWVETTAKTVDEAKDLLLDRLGVHDDEAEFEILEEPKPGLFGRTRGQARVRARVRPKQPRQKDERRRRPARGKGKEGGGSGRSDSPKAAPKTDDVVEESGSEVEDTAAPAPRPAPAPRSAPSADAPERPAMDPAEAATAAEGFVSELISQMGIDGTVGSSLTDDGDIDLRVDGAGLGRLIGPRGGMIRVIEELCRTRLQHLAAGGSTPRVRVDVGNYRELRRSTLEALVDETIEAVRSSGEPRVLDVVTASERKQVHDRIGETASDLTTRSEGEDPTRRVVVLPAS